MNTNIRVPGWRSSESNSTLRWKISVREKSYPGSGLNFSRVEFQILLSRSATVCHVVCVLCVRVVCALCERCAWG